MTLTSVQTLPLCACGCGRQVGLAACTSPRHGLVKGQPTKYLRGHRAPRDPQERFWPNVDKGDGTGCWTWTASTNSGGYGIFSAGNRSVLAHRFAYELLVGPIPDGMSLDHVAARGCRHRHCVNPAHLEPVTHVENMRRARLTHCKRGHELAGENLILERDSKGRDVRRCRTCRVESRRSAAA